MYGEYSLNTNTGLNHIKLDPLYNDIIKNQSDKRIQFLKIVLQAIIRLDRF